MKPALDELDGDRVAVSPEYAQMLLNKIKPKGKVMKSFWIKFNGRPAGCVEAEDESTAAEIGAKETGFEVVSCQSLPYPASPRINQYVHPQHGVCPSFCFKPEQCCGSTACPQRYSCVE